MADYGFYRQLECTPEEAEDKIREKLAEVGFGILTEINVQKTFKEKLGIDHKKYKILGACNPHLAQEALEKEPNIGLLMPCNVIIVDNEDGTCQVGYADAVEMLKVTENDQIMDIARRANDLLKKALP
ncbi:MAG TPA: DUF302 domain-containing protein [Candidatus Marinimicrobia bacterium]|nr:DUF302 domain-containing protein [Candidatus Neomarinimicrobiota bacterium]HIB32485.1 DUF302 domain-containing protein [Candidatus Neomarinimicrobiota bacterium]